jgi:type IV secretion system protein VirD4
MGSATLGRRSLLWLGAASAWAIALVLWKLLTLSAIWVVISISLCFCLTVFLLWLRLTLAKTAWSKLWLIIAPFLMESLVTIPRVPFVLLLSLLLLIYILLGLWGYIRFYPLHVSRSLYRARFAIIDELSHLLSKTPSPDGLLLGIHKSVRHFVMVRPQPTRKEIGNLLIVGPTRCGKGLLAVSQLLSWQGSVVVNDIKGELFSATAGYRSTLGPVFVIDPTGVGHAYDPLLGKETEDDFLSASTHLLFKADEGDGTIFTQRATDMLTQLFTAARREEIAPLPYVRHCIRIGLTDTIARLQLVSPSLATQFLDVRLEDANLSDRFLLSSWGTLKAKMRPLLTETVVRCFATSDFAAEQLVSAERPVSVYLRWPERDLLALSPLVRLLWGSLIDEIITAYDTKQGKECRPVLMLIDEAGRTAIPSLADHATTVVGRGVSLWIAIQSLSQLEVVYGKARAQVLRDNMESQIYYSPTDLATSEYLERRLGSRSAYAHSTTERGGEETSSGLSERPIPLLSAQDILQLKEEEIIGFHRRLPPFRLSRIDWRKHPLLQQRRKMAAPQLSALPQLAGIPEVVGEGSEVGDIREHDILF